MQRKLRYGASLQNVPRQLRKAAIANHSTSPRWIFLGNVVRDRFLDCISSWILGSLAPKGWRALQLSFESTPHIGWRRRDK
jgi:hypothetical protein